MPKQKQLKNGIRVVYEQIPAIRSVSIGIWVGAGSLHEYAEINGITHFIEHMLFKGTTSRSAKQIAVEMDSIGGSINAFTAKECTCYYAKVLDEHLRIAVDLLCDILLHSELVSEEMEREKGVVCEEIYMTEDSPEDLVFEVGAALFFADTTLERPILGTEETVQRLRREDLQSYMRTHYTNDNMVVACVGSFDPAELLNLLETRLAAASELALRNPQPYAIKPGFRTAFAQKDIEQIHTCISFPAFALETDEYYALCVLSNILGGSMSVVGPRPQLIRDAAFMTPAQRQRHAVRGGLTGLAQIRGRNNIPWEDKLAYDVEYIQKVTLWGDIKIIFRTVVKSAARADINAQGLDTADDLGDYLLKTGAISEQRYASVMRSVK